jgi:hypothetical protein
MATIKIAYHPILWKIVIQNRAVRKFYATPFFCKTEPETIGAVHHGLCRRPWQSSACIAIKLSHELVFTNNS